VLLMPMWLLSGAFFPGSDTGWLSWLMRLNPLSYGVAGLRRLLYAPAEIPASVTFPSLSLSLLVMSGFSVVCVAAAVGLASRPSVHNVR